MRKAVLCFLLCVSNSAIAGEFAPLLQRPILGRCHMDVCWWVSLEDAKLIGKSSKGELYAFSSKNWQAEGPGSKRKLDGRGITYIFCSKTTPAWISKTEGKQSWTAQFMRPDDPDAYAGVTEGIYRIYLAACHHVEILDIEKQIKTARKLGYMTSGIIDEMKLSTPQEILSK
jgi:hypothetical protein